MENDFFKNIHFIKGQPEAGKLLISEPFMLDKHFQRSVILLAEHSTESTVGFVLNKPAKHKLNQLLNDPELPEFNVYIGGPVGENMLFFIHTLGNLLPGSIQISEHIYWGQSFEELKSLMMLGKISEHQVRFFIGYSGWGANQLQREFKENSWILAKMNDDLIMQSQPKLFWKKALSSLGKSYKILANFPKDPTQN